MEERPPPSDGRAGPKVIRAGELSLPFLGCCTQKSGPSTLTGLHSRAGPGGVGVGEPTLRVGGGRIGPTPYSWLQGVN